MSDPPAGLARLSAPARRRLSLLLIAPGLVVAASIVGNALMPKLIADYPLLLIALNVRPRNLILTSGSPAIAWFAVATFRLFILDPFMYLIGRDYGSIALDYVESKSGWAGRWMRKFESWFAKASYFFIFFASGPLVCLLSGASRIPVRRFVAVDLVGTVVTLALLRSFGKVFEGPLNWLVALISEHSGWLTIVTISLAVLEVLRRYRTYRRSGLGPKPEEE